MTKIFMLLVKTDQFYLCKQCFLFKVSRLAFNISMSIGTQVFLVNMHPIMVE